MIRETGVVLIVAAAGLLALGLITLFAARIPGLPLGKLPGDFRWERRGITVYLPIATCLVLSLLLTFILRLLLRR